MNRRHVSRDIRKKRVRKRLSVSATRPRLSVFRSHKHLYAQIIDDTSGKTLVAASTRSKELKGSLQKTTTKEAAEKVGQLIARKAKEQKVEKVAFDRGPYLFHGRVKALAEAAKKDGLKF